jgi:hypothetical protein
MKAILQLQIAQMKFQMQVQDQSLRRDKAIHARIDVLTSIVSRYIEITQSEWSDNSEEVKTFLSILNEMKKLKGIRRLESRSNHLLRQMGAELAEYEAMVKAMPDDE